MLETRIIDSEDKLQEVMQAIKTGDIDYQPPIVNEVLNMELDPPRIPGASLTDSPTGKRQFGLPLPGEPSLTNTVEKMQLQVLQQNLAAMMSQLTSNPEVMANIDKATQQVLAEAEVRSLQSKALSGTGHFQGIDAGMLDSFGTQHQRQQSMPERPQHPVRFEDAEVPGKIHGADGSLEQNPFQT